MPSKSISIGASLSQKGAFSICKKVISDIGLPFNENNLQLQAQEQLSWGSTGNPATILVIC
ncbi:MAG: hypothetical protein P8P74_04310 [Crocinitomicaceae bacterium]|nr:hypothetical protein [Crocinitomicaceae bacterium]